MILREQMIIRYGPRKKTMKVMAKMMPKTMSRSENAGQMPYRDETDDDAPVNDDAGAIRRRNLNQQTNPQTSCKQQKIKA